MKFFKVRYLALVTVLNTCSPVGAVSVGQFGEKKKKWTYSAGDVLFSNSSPGEIRVFS